LILQIVGSNLFGQNLSAEFAAILLGIVRRYGGTVIPHSGNGAYCVARLEHSREGDFHS
jgi:hypothetical protein